MRIRKTPLPTQEDPLAPFLARLAPIAAPKPKLSSPASASAWFWGPEVAEAAQQQQDQHSSAVTTTALHARPMQAPQPLAAHQHLQHPFAAQLGQQAVHGLMPAMHGAQHMGMGMELDPVSPWGSSRSCASVQSLAVFQDSNADAPFGSTQKSG